MTPPRPTTIACDVGPVPADALAVDALARLQLTARRSGREIRLRNSTRELQELIAFVGLREVLRVETVGEAEEREQPLGVEEERELDDPAL
jgi:hypothetical protein